jgi:putative transposase
MVKTYKMLKAIKIRLYPNFEQQIYINKLLGSNRFVYNNCLAYKIDNYNNNKINIGFSELGKYLTNLKRKEEYRWLNESHSKVLQQSLINLDLAYKSFFKNGNGFPKFKSKHNHKQSCRFPIDAIGVIYGNRINIIKQLKNIHFKCSIVDEKYLNHNQNLIKSATLVKTKSNRYYFSILIDKQNNKILPKPNNNIIGIDLGIKDFIVTSRNQKFKNIKSIRNNEKQLIGLQKQLNKKVIGSKNRNKVRFKLARKYEKINNIKENYLHNISNHLLNENQVIVIEDLNVNGLLKNHHLAKSIQELSLGEFKRKLLYKADWYNRTIIEIDRWYPSSKLCSCCGYKNNHLKLSNREWICPKCGIKHDRDYNAAKNIENEGNRILLIKEKKLNNKKIGLSSPELTLVDYPLMDDKAEMPLKSYDRLKQEKNELKENVI